MINISFTNYNFKFRIIDGKNCIYDAIRNKWIIITPEEWVRQNIIKYLQETLHYPTSLFAVEKEIQVGDVKKRFDIVIYKESLPWMIIECKQNDVEVNEAVLHQTLHYNSQVQAPFLCLTNGAITHLWHFEKDAINELNEFPKW